MKERKIPEWVKCPECGSTDLEFDEDDNYYCENCDYHFDDDEVLEKEEPK